MFVSQLAIAMVLGLKLKDHSAEGPAHDLAIFVVLMVCIFVASFAWSWGSLGVVDPKRDVSHWRPGRLAEA